MVSAPPWGATPDDARGMVLAQTTGIAPVGQTGAPAAVSDARLEQWIDAAGGQVAVGIRGYDRFVPATPPDPQLKPGDWTGRPELVDAIEASAAHLCVLYAASLLSSVLFPTRARGGDALADDLWKRWTAGLAELVGYVRQELTDLDEIEPPAEEDEAALEHGYGGAVAAPSPSLRNPYTNLPLLF